MMWHPWTAWECYAAGMYDGNPKENGEAMYAEFLADDERFREALDRVLREWPISCEHFLTKNMNRIAWLGQAAMCIATGTPRTHRAGFMLLSESDQRTANATAAEFLRKWERENTDSAVHRQVGAQGVFEWYS